MSELWQELSNQMEGPLYTDHFTRLLYATDASAYREFPMAVAVPANEQDIEKIVRFAFAHKIPIVPRTAGTSLAGQVVGGGLIVDFSKNFRSILEVNPAQHYVRVQPGVIRDDLNYFLKSYGLFFGPETSTASRAMIAGMVGNNSCGSHSIIYKSTREHVLEIRGFLSDGSPVVFGPLSREAFEQKCTLDSLEGRIYRFLKLKLSDSKIRDRIIKEFPKPSIERRNTGYALDLLLKQEPFTPGAEPFNMCSLIAGSEGTLSVITEIKLHVDSLPPVNTALICVHFNSVREALKANLVGLAYHPRAIELIDHYILECTKDNIEQSHNRFFIEGDPKAILFIELGAKDKEALDEQIKTVINRFREESLGFAYPVVFAEDMKKVWALRKAGLGLLGNLPGDEKAVAVIEDTAIDPEDLPQFVEDFDKILSTHGLFAVHYGHAATGELHLRPILDLKSETGHKLFRTLASEVAGLVKRYHGSLSGEHGDGRLRGEFIPFMVGAENYALFEELKKTWDPFAILNPGKIVQTPKMDTMLRYESGKKTEVPATIFRFHKQNILQHAEQCNGSGDCRKSFLSQGTMCPSYMATGDERNTTRARANMLRETLTNSTKSNPYDSEELYRVMDLCLSCKGCKSECPSSIDMAKMKAEFLQHYHEAHGIPFRSWIVAHFRDVSKLASFMPSVYNFFVHSEFFSGLIKDMIGFARERSLPPLYAFTLEAWYKRYRKVHPLKDHKRRVYFFCDEFTNYNDTPIGIKAILLLESLGYQVEIPIHVESGRASVSKGLLLRAKKIADHNIELLSVVVNKNEPLIGIEPSACLSFRDEYPDLVSSYLKPAAVDLSKNVFLIDEFIMREVEAGHIGPDSFTELPQKIRLHGHCQQKSVGSLLATEKMLCIPLNYTVNRIGSGCCGMAGSFGFEKEHYDLSKKIAELVLVPAVQSMEQGEIVAAPGTSCRHQILDLTGVKAFHPVEIMYEALKEKPQEEVL